MTLSYTKDAPASRSSAAKLMIWLGQIVANVPAAALTVQKCLTARFAESHETSGTSLEVEADLRPKMTPMDPMNTALECRGLLAK